MLCEWNVNYLTYTYVLPMYRAPTGDFELFLNKLENINYFYKPDVESVNCSNIDIVLLKVTKNSA